MNENIINLIIQAKNLSSNALNQVKGQLGDLQKTSEKAGNVMAGMGDNFKKAVSAVAIGAGIMGGALGVLGGIALSSAGNYETMGVALETAFGGNIEMAKAAQKQITEFATKTPYDLNQVMTGFIKLKNMGLDPSEKAMTSYGNTASAMGKDLNSMVEAVADAATGEFERLKEFGIRASSQGDKVSFTFKGITTTVGKNSKEIEDYLIKLGETNFAGGMEKQSQTLNGKLSTLKDTFDQTMASFAKDSGLLDWAKKAVDGATMVISSFKPLYDLIVKGEVGGGLIFGFAEDSKVVENIDNIRNAIIEVFELVRSGGEEAMDGGMWIREVFGDVAFDVLITFIDYWNNQLIPAFNHFKDVILPSLIGKVKEVWKDLDIFGKNLETTKAIAFGVAGVIGTVLVGSLASLIGSFSTLALGIIAVNLPFVLLGSLFAGLYLAFQNQEGIIKTLQGYWGQFSSKMTSFGKWLADMFKPELETLNSVWNNFIEIMKTLWNNLQPLIAIIYILATQALQAVFYAFEQLRQPLNDFIQAIFNIARPIIDILAPAFVFIVGLISTILIPVFQLVWAIVVQAFKGILQIITGVINMVSGLMNVWIGLIKGLFTGDFSQAAEGFKQIWKSLEQFLWGIIDLVLSPIRGIIDGIGNIFKGFDLAKIGVNMMNNLADGLWGAVNVAMGPINWLAGQVKSVLGMQAQAQRNSQSTYNFGTAKSGKGNAWAMGGAFQNGNVVAFADGGVVNRPTNFAMSGGRLGLMGEAGAEAIMPLSRGKDGKLGVKAEGGGSTVIINNPVFLSGDENVARQFVKSIEDQLFKSFQKFSKI